MKRSNTLAVLLLIVGTFGSISAKKSSCDCEGTGKSYLFVRQHFLSASPERVAAFRNERVNVVKEGYLGAFQAVFYGSKSSDEVALRRYFTPFCKLSLVVDSRIGTLNHNVRKDLLAEHFNIFTTDNTNFRSRIRFNPSQSVVGVGLQYRQAFKQNEEKGRGFFFSAAAPLARVQNKMELWETVLNPGEINESAAEHVVANMKEAFKQSDWCYGKIDCKSRSKTRLAFVELKIGYEWLQHIPYHMESYFGILLPTGNKPNGEYVFEPVVGNGGHFGATFGSSIGFQIWDNDETDRHLRVEYANNTKYLLGNSQKRSFDLVNKPFSRYIQVYNSSAQAKLANANMDANLATPGINIFTLDTKVKPGVSHTINTAFVFTSGGFQAEAGYNFYAQSSECLELECPFPENIAIKDENGKGETNPIRDITGNFLKETGGTLDFGTDEYAYAEICEKDIDLTSAATPCLLSHTLFASLGYRWDHRDHPPFINGGASYEFSHATKAVMERWTIWLKGGLSF